MFLDPEDQNEGTKASVPGPQKPERGYKKQNHGTNKLKNRNGGRFAKIALKKLPVCFLSMLAKRVQRVLKKPYATIL